MKKIDKNSGFKVPEHYFEGLGEKLLDKAGQISSSPEARVFPKEPVFTVPECYYKIMNKRVHQKLDRKEFRVVRLHRYKKIYYATAAAAAGLLLFFGLRSSLQRQLTFSDLASQDIEDYFQNNELDMSSYEIAEMLPLDQLEINDVMNNGIQDAAILDYLDNNMDNLEDLNLNYDE